MMIFMCAGEVVTELKELVSSCRQYFGFCAVNVKAVQEDTDSEVTDGKFGQLIHSVCSGYCFR